MLELPQSTVRAVIVKWKRLGATTAQQRSGKPHELTERDHQVLKRVKMVYPRLQHSLPSSKLPLESTSAQEPQHFGEGFFCFGMTMHKARSLQKWFVEISEEELD